LFQSIESFFEQAQPFIAIQIIVFSLLLLAFMRTKKYSMSVQVIFLYISIYYLLFLLSHHIASDVINTLAMAIGFAEGPVILWLALSFSIGNVKKISHWHWLPMILSIGLYSLDSLLMQNFLYALVSISRVLYGIVCLRLLWGTWSETHDSRWHHWVLTLVLYMLALALIKLGAFAVYHSDKTWHAPDWLIFAKTTGAAIVILVMVWWALLKPKIFDEARTHQLKKDPSANEKETYDQLIKLFESDEIYLESNLNLEGLANRLSVNKRDLSESINKVTGEGFRSLLRKYRINKACEILSSQESKNKKILEIAMTSGYSTKSDFNASFKLQEGVSPSQFKQVPRVSQKVH
jgi:AraC-like DNA-binding protein